VSLDGLVGKGYLLERKVCPYASIKIIVNVVKE
jgi:hypothetical protein